MIDLRNLKEIRKDACIGQKEIAKALNIKPDAYSKYETNGAIPSLEVVYNFARYFELNIDFVLNLKEKRSKAIYPSFDRQRLVSKLQELRTSKSLSQTGLAIKLGITQSAIHRYENALSNPSLNVLDKYCKYFKITFHELVTYK